MTKTKIGSIKIQWGTDLQKVMDVHDFLPSHAYKLYGLSWKGIFVGIIFASYQSEKESE